MCGIVGYVGERPCRDLLIAGLEKLEYRGYDSAGISLLAGRPDRHRARGRQPRQPARGGRPRRRAQRRRRRGRRRRAAGDDRARPHALGDPRPGHRGERASARRLRRTASTSSSTGSSRTTPSCAATLDGRGPSVQLRDRRRDRRPPDRAALRRRPDRGGPRARSRELRGHYAFVAMHAEHPGTLVAARQECPLIVGLGEGETLRRLGDPRLPRRDPDGSRRERRDRHDRRRRGARSRTPTATPVERDVEESPGTRRRPRRAATRPSC